MLSLKKDCYLCAFFHKTIMSDEIKHECGLAFIRLRKPFSYYLQKYGTVMYGVNKLYLLMENSTTAVRMAPELLQ